jgi:hypothetical protein
MSSCPAVKFSELAKSGAVSLRQLWFLRFVNHGAVSGNLARLSESHGAVMPVGAFLIGLFSATAKLWFQRDRVS